MQQVRNHGVDLTVICIEEGLKLTPDLAVRATMALDNGFVKPRQRSVRRKWREMWKKFPCTGPIGMGTMLPAHGEG